MVISLPFEGYHKFLNDDVKFLHAEFDALTGSKISSIDIGAPVVRMSYSPTSGHAVIAILEVCLQIASCLGCLNCVEYSNTSGV